MVITCPYVVAASVRPKAKTALLPSHFLYVLIAEAGLLAEIAAAKHRAHNLRISPSRTIEVQYAYATRTPRPETPSRCHRERRPRHADCDGTDRGKAGA